MEKFKQFLQSNKVSYMFFVVILVIIVLHLSFGYLFRYNIRQNSLLRQYEKELNTSLLPSGMIIYSMQYESETKQLFDKKCLLEKEIYQVRPAFYSRNIDVVKYQNETLSNIFRWSAYQYYNNYLGNKGVFDEKGAEWGIQQDIFDVDLFKLYYTIKNDQSYQWLLITNTKVIWQDDWEPSSLINNWFIDGQNDIINLDLYYIELIEITPKSRFCFDTFANPIDIFYYSNWQTIP